MKLRKFFGSSSRMVLQQVRTELGADAVIVMNKPTAQGIEITAVAGAEMQTMFDPQENPAAAPSAAVKKDEAAKEDAPAAAPAGEPEAPPVLAQTLMSELKAMRSIVEAQLAQLAWTDAARRAPSKAKLTRELLGAGFGAQLAREIAKALPDDYSPAQAQQWLESVLTSNLHCVAAEDDIVARGGVYALIGPTGVGKTTTVAKLAARCVVKYGAASLALLTTDGYRIGAHDQLRIYAKILGVTVHTIRDAEDLEQTLAGLAGRHLVLIDTVGMSQRDQRVAEQALLLGRSDVARILVLQAGAQAETLEEVLHAYRGDGQALAGCVVSKIDEAARTGQVLDVLIRNRLPLHYIANGQRVPEDLHLPNVHYLVHRALKAGQTAPRMTPFTLQDGECALVMSGVTGMPIDAGAAHA